VNLNFIYGDSTNGTSSAWIAFGGDVPFCANMFGSMQRTALPVRHVGNALVSAQDKLDELIPLLGNFAQEQDKIPTLMKALRHAKLAPGDVNRFCERMFPTVLDSQGNAIPLSDERNKAVRRDREAYAEAFETSPGMNIHHEGIGDGLASTQDSVFGLFMASTYLSTHKQSVRVKDKFDLTTTLADGTQVTNEVDAKTYAQAGHATHVEGVKRGRMAMNTLTYRPDSSLEIDGANPFPKAQVVADGKNASRRDVMELPARTLALASQYLDDRNVA
jgi:hypothetical protein